MLAPSQDRMTSAISRRRHRWGDPKRFYNNPDRPDIGKTERECTNGCGIIKVTVKPGGSNRPWQEFWKDGERIECDATPECEGGQG